MPTTEPDRGDFLPGGSGMARQSGPSLSLLNNDAYIPVLSPAKHLRVLGRPGREYWAEIWNAIGPMLDRVLATWMRPLRLWLASPGPSRRRRAEEESRIQGLGPGATIN